MDCTAPLFLETLIRSAIVVQPGRLCGTAFIGGKDIGATEDFDCDTAEKGWAELLFDALIEGDSAIGVDVIDGDAGDIERIDECNGEGLETLFRSALIIGASGNKVKVFRVDGLSANCEDCDGATAMVPALTRVLGTFVRVGDEIRVRVQNTGTFPDAATIDCSQAGVSAMAMVAASISYDTTTKTWFWNTTEI